MTNALVSCFIATQNNAWNKIYRRQKTPTPVLLVQFDFFIGKNRHVPVERNLCRLDYAKTTKIVPGETKTFGLVALPQC